MQQGNKSRFVISLDFELLWGVRDKRTVESYGENIRGVRQVIPGLLDLFERYDIRATFATVGFLFARNKAELERYIPAELPNYSLQKYSPYENGYLSSIGASETGDVYHYGESLVRMIRQHPEQEIASHTFSHFYCLEKASLSSFEADLRAAQNIAASHNVDLKSIVFPRNQYSKEHLAVCKKLGFLAFRGNEPSSIYRPRKNEELTWKIRGTKLVDSYLNVTGHHSFTPKVEHGLVNVPASRFLRPFSSKLQFLDQLRLNRIRKSMSFAAQNGQGYHLWWHPHNFGVTLKENLNFLEQILQHYRFLHQTYGMKSQTMKETAKEILQTHAAV